jgi:hypothetical protein
LSRGGLSLLLVELFEKNARIYYFTCDCEFNIVIIIIIIIIVTNERSVSNIDAAEISLSLSSLPMNAQFQTSTLLRFHYRYHRYQ